MGYNFTMRDNPPDNEPGAGGLQWGQGQPISDEERAKRGDHGEVWNNDTKQWEQGPNEQRYEAGAWGNEGNSVGPDGKTVLEGTSGMQKDVNRYQAMGQNQQAAPTLNPGQYQESRGLSMGSLGLLRSRAEGGMTPAQQMQAQQTKGAVAGVQSGAASVRGGAGNRAAASRMAGQAGAAAQMQGDADQRALRAREMADASGQLVNATSAQRQNDLGFAKGNADMQAQQNALNDNRENFYENEAYNTKRANADAQQGQSDDDIARRNLRRQDEQHDREVAHWVADTTVGTVGGAVQGAAGVTGSDERMKQNMTTLSPGEAKKNVKPVIPSARGRMNQRSKELAEPSYDRSMFSKNEGAKGSEHLHAGIQSIIAQDAAEAMPQNRGSLKEGAYKQALHGMPDDTPKGVTGAPKGLAAARFGKPGALGDTSTSYDLGTGYSEDPVIRNGRQQLAPGTADDVGGGEVKDAHSRAIMGLEPIKTPTPMRSKPQSGYDAIFSDEKTKKNEKPVESAEVKKAREDAEDAAEVAKFTKGDKPGVSFDFKKERESKTPEELRQEAQDELNEAAWAARERVDQQKKAAQAEEDQAREKYITTRDAEQMGKVRKGVFGEYFGRKLAEKRSEETPEHRAQRAEEWRKSDQGYRDRDAEQRANPPALGKVWPFKQILEADHKYNPRPRQPTSMKRGEGAEERDMTLSPGEAKKEIRPLSGYEDTQIHSLGYEGKDGGDATVLWDGGVKGRGHSRDVVINDDAADTSSEGRFGGRARLGGTTGKVNMADAERARAEAIEARKKADEAAKPKPKPKKMNPDAMRAYAERMLAAQQVQNAAQLEAGPAVSAPQQAQEQHVVTPMVDEHPYDNYSYSDEKTKKGKSDSDPMAGAMRAMHPYEYEYKDGFREQENQKPGEKNVGPMAQELDKDPVARTALTTDPGTGLMAIDKSKGLKLVMGGLSDLQRQVDEMKRRKA